MFVALLWAARSRISFIFNFNINMHKQILILIAAAMTSAAINGMANPSPTPPASAQKYTCVMHPEVVMDHPGNCPKCGMKLVPLKEKKPEPHAKIDNHSMHAAMKHDGHETHMSMQSSVNIADPMNRESSGTSWVPDSTPMYGRMFMLGDDMLMGELKDRGNNHAFIGLGTVGDAHPRRRLYETVSEFGFQIVPAIHTTAVISSSAQIGVGPTIMAGVVVNASAVIGDNVIVNTGAIVEHDCLVGDHAHIATGARLAGGVHVGACAHIGIGAVVRQEIRIGAGAIVGAGAVVVRDVPDRTTVVGVPAKIRATD